MTDLEVHRFGSGERLVLAAHGITGSALAWPAVAAALPADWTLVAPDLRGRGGSRHLPASSGLRDHAVDLVGLATELGAEHGGPIVLAGHSMGAFVAVHTAFARPDLVSRVVLVDGGVSLQLPDGADPDAVLEASLGPSIERLSQTFADVETYVDFFRAHPALGPHWGSVIEDYARYDAIPVDARGLTEPLSGAVRSASQAESVRADGRDLLVDGASFDPEVRTTPLPVHLLVAPLGMFGEAPGLLPDASVAAYDGSPEVAHVRVETVPGVNHYTILFDPAGAGRVAAAISD